MSNELAVSNQGELLAPLSMPAAIARYNAVLDFTKTIMKPNKDYGIIPGTNKPTLLKPGAEKLCSFFGLSVDYIENEKVQDWQGGFFYYSYKAVLTRHGEIIATGIGSCNSKEKKYRYRNSERKCPACGKPTIIKGKDEYGGGFICFAKKGGCGAKFKDNDPKIIDQPTGQVENTEPFDLVNTIQKMAQKRALIAATLIAANASEFYTQDIEDLEIIDADFVATDLPPEPPPISEDEKFLITLRDALEARGFTDTGRKRVAALACKQEKVSFTKDLNPDARKRLLAAVGDGKFDKLKDTNGAAAAAR